MAHGRLQPGQVFAGYHIENRSASAEWAPCISPATRICRNLLR